MYKYNKEHIEKIRRANHELKSCKSWEDLENLITKAAPRGLVMVSARRPGVQIYHIQKASVQRKGKDLALYLVDDGVHAGACAVPNLYRHFMFRMSYHKAGQND
jgi:hypothetical protein